MSKKTDLLFDTFAGEHVEIVQDFEVTTQLHIDPESGTPAEIRMPMTVTGVVMDTDGEFLFLSADGQEVNQALPIWTIKHIGIVDTTDTMQAVLDSIEPEDGNSYN
jgi:hypothetical protein